MKQIEVGTCIAGTNVEQWLPHIVEAGFETIAITFHMSLEGMDLEELAKKTNSILEGTNTRVSCIGLYCNPIQYEEHKKMLEYVIDCAPLFGAKVVSTFAGAYEGKSVEDAIPKFGEVFRDLAKRAAGKGIKIGIENCMMGGTWDNCTCNIGFNPKAWEMMFKEVPDENFGLQWEPAHQMSQLIDPVAQLRKWAHKVVHLHGKDSTIDMDAVRTYGVSGAASFVYDRTPGFGDTNWRDIFTILHQAGYDGDVCIEGFHDIIYKDEWEMTSQLHALNYLKWCRGGEFVPNPWD